MKLSEYKIKIDYDNKMKLYEGVLDNGDIYNIVYTGIEDDGESAVYGILFGSSRIYEAESRSKHAFKLYKEKRLLKIIICGGTKGISSKEKNQTPLAISNLSEDYDKKYDDCYSEAYRMKLLLISYGVREEDIIIIENANNTIDTFKILSKDEELNLKKEKNIILISTSYHLKRCLANAMKYLSDDIHYIFSFPQTNIFEKDNFMHNPLGMQILNFEAFHLIRQAREGIIYDLELPSIENKKLEKKM